MLNKKHWAWQNASKHIVSTTALLQACDMPSHGSYRLTRERLEHFPLHKEPGSFAN
jgi:hypothetical protein